MNKQCPRMCTLLIPALLLLLAGSAAQATISHTWVSSTGSDTNACTRSAPCATFAGALTKTSSGGEIDVVDAADYGAVTISQAVSIEAVGVLATIQVTSGNAITVSAGASDIVVLRGLTLDGQGTATHGISLSTGGQLYVENTRINHFGGYAVDFEPTATSKLFVTDTIVRNNGSGSTGGGIFIQPGSSGSATASIDGLRTDENVFGVKVLDNVDVTIRNSFASNNGFSGFSAVLSGHVPSMLLESCVTAHNGTAGVTSGNLAPLSGLVPNVRISNVTITDNATGLSDSTTAPIISFLNNKNDGNTTNGAPTSTVNPQ